jgi:predicted nucleotide-binding protein
LEGLALRIESVGVAASKASTSEMLPASVASSDSRKVFVVHGHDSGAKESVARLLDRLALVPIVLHEQANEGRTIVEKFEVFSDVPFAVVLMTGDDVGRLASQPTAELQSRARQNVLLELGYFIGKLGRSRVVALHKHGVEIPSDLHGVLYIELDEPGAWRTKLTQELVTAGLNPRVEGLVNGR